MSAPVSHVLSPADTRAHAFLFFATPGDGGRGAPVLRAEYRALACRRCGKFPEDAALARGVSGDFRLPARAASVYGTLDHQVVVTSAVRAAQESVPGLVARFYSVPSDADRWVVRPVRRFAPAPDSRIDTPVEPRVEGEPFQRRGPPCRRCGRSREVTWWPPFFAVPDDVVLASAVCETASHDCVAWIARADVIAALRSGKFGGWRSHPLGGNSGA